MRDSESRVRERDRERKEEGDREKPGRNASKREVGRGGGRVSGRVYICMSAEGTMYSNCEKKGCTFLRKVTEVMGKKCDRLVNEARWSIEWISMGSWDDRLRSYGIPCQVYGNTGT